MKKQIIDQAAHMFAAMAVLAPLLIWPSPVAGALSGLGAGLIREITEQGSPLSGGSLLDLLFWSIGGALAVVALT